MSKSKKLVDTYLESQIPFYHEIIEALIKYSSLSMDDTPLLSLIKRKNYREFMAFTQSKLPSTLSCYRGVGYLGLLGNKEYIKDVRGLVESLGVLSSWALDKPASEFKSSYIMLHAKVPKKFILAASTVTPKGFTIKNEHEILLLNAKFKISNQSYDTDYDTGKMINIRVEGKIV